MTDRQTDRQTDGRVIAYSALSMLSRAKNRLLQANVNVIVVLNANVLRLDEDRRQRRSGISIWTGKYHG